jgi:SAM-dependent methyltransferase
VPRDELTELLNEQTAYYRARAEEYDQTSPFAAEGAPFAAELAEIRAALQAFCPRGRVLELACGSGQWTVELARYASHLTAVDTSPEMLALSRARVGGGDVVYVEADLFDWSPPEQFDVVFFAAWLSHIPPQRFERFWGLVDDGLRPDGRVFIIDELPAEAALEQAIGDAVAPAVERRLTTGARYRTVKVLYEPDVLRDRLASLGWRVDIHTVGWRFFYAAGRRAS